MIYKLIILTLLLSFSGNVLANTLDNKQKIEDLQDTTDESDEDLKDRFTDEDGNILDPYKIPSLKAKINEWKILVGNIDGKKVCYAITRPFAKIGNHKDIRDSYLMVIYWNKARQDINISMGFNFRPGSKIKISVDGKQFIANPNGSIAMPSRTAIDTEIVKSMLYAKKIMIKGDAKIGTYAVDAYNTQDFQDVYAKLVDLCDFM